MGELEKGHDYRQESEYSRLRRQRMANEAAEERLRASRERRRDERERKAQTRLRELQALDREWTLEEEASAARCLRTLEDARFTREFERCVDLEEKYGAAAIIGCALFVVVAMALILAA